MSTKADLIAAVEAAGGAATLGKSQAMGGNVNIYYVNIIGPIVNDAGPYEQKKIVVQNDESAEEVAIWWGDVPNILKPPAATITPIGTDQQVLAAAATTIDMTGKKVLHKTIQHFADHSVVSARVATVATSRFSDYLAVVIKNGSNYEAYLQA